MNSMLKHHIAVSVDVSVTTPKQIVRIMPTYNTKSLRVEKGATSLPDDIILSNVIYNICTHEKELLPYNYILENSGGIWSNRDCSSYLIVVGFVHSLSHSVYKTPLNSVPERGAITICD